MSVVRKGRPRLNETHRFVLRSLRRQPIEAAVAVVAVLVGFMQLAELEVSPSVAAQGRISVTLFGLFLLFGGLLAISGLTARTPSHPERGFTAERAGLMMLATALLAYGLSAFAAGAFVSGVFYSALCVGFLVRSVEARYQDESLRALGGSRYKRVHIRLEEEDR